MQFSRANFAGAVHPHACGEYIVRLDHGEAESGSSPRMWGIHLIKRPVEYRERFIPTHVGNTSDVVPEGIRKAVHPHACGEYFLTTGNYSLDAGSSPRMWGIRLSCYCHRK